MSDSNGVEVAAVAGIGVSVGEKLEKFLDDYKHPRRFVSRVLMATAVDSKGWIVFPPCAEGKIWHVRRVSVMNGTAFAGGAAGSLAAVCIGLADSGTMKLTEVVQPGTQIPFIASWGFDEFPVKTGEQLYVVVNGGSGNELASANVSEEDV